VLPGTLMGDLKRTKAELIHDLMEMRKTIDALEASRSEIQKAEKKYREKLIEYEKLSALGRLTANVAHEIRNPITVIGGLARRLERSLSPGTKEKEYLELISLEAKRLEELLRNVLVFSSSAFFQREREDINTIMRECLEIYSDVCKSKSIMAEAFLGAVPSLYIDKRQVGEAISNLLSNAIDAMKDGGLLTATTTEDFINGKSYVKVRIADTGTGIPEEKIRMIFEPFFSTKVDKTETGLGLPITKKIVEGHGGFMRVESIPGKGTAFDLFFPYRSR
jgi:signal transduction histidine kinase